MKCNQKGPPECDNPPAFRFTWPGRDEAHICAIHALKLRGVANAMGLHVQLIQLTPDDYLTEPSRRASAAEAQGGER